MQALQVKKKKKNFTKQKVNENCDRDVRLDMEDSLNFIAPENQDYYRHTTEGSDDMRK